MQYQEINKNLFHTYNPLQAKPILLYNDAIICPLPKLLYYQIPNSIYYSIVDKKGFQSAFGTSFQKYIGNVLSKCCISKDLTIYPERNFKSSKGGKATTDWILTSSNTIMFIECKAKRLTLLSKAHLNEDEDGGIRSDLKKMASFIVQIYKTYIDYQNNHYPHINFDQQKMFIPVIITLEDWYINFNGELSELLNNYVDELLITNGINPELRQKYPYYIYSADEFEREIQLIDHLGMHNYFEKVLNHTIGTIRESYQYIHPCGDAAKQYFKEQLDLEKI